MNKKMISILFLFLIISCNTSKQNNNTSIDLTFLKTHMPNIKNGKIIFNQSCITCHLYGTAGAAILTDKNSWVKLLKEKNKEDIYLNVLNGFIGEKGPMPEKGTCIKCSNIDLFDAIEYILSVNGLSINH